MSANQKQVPQSQSRYVQGSEGYHVAQNFVQQQQQPNNQVPPLRMPPTGPTQSSTPPNADLKVQSMSQPSSMSLFVQQGRGPTSQSYYTRPQQQTNQNPRMANHRQGQPPIFPSPSPPYLPMQLLPQTQYIHPAGQLYSTQRTPGGYVQAYSMVHNQTMYAYPQAAQSQAASYYINQFMTPRAVPAPQSATQPPPPSMSLQQPTQMYSGGTKRRRANAVAIIDPNTGKDKLNELYEEEESLSHPPSGESSARETPQPPNVNSKKEIQAMFAKNVAQAISKDEIPGAEEIEQIPIVEYDPYLFQPPLTHHTKYDPLVQSSKLQAGTKEFVPGGFAKETTPVVSAITDAEEVTINTSNKQKDRDSPAKGRSKIRDQVIPREVPIKDIAANDKPNSAARDEVKPKDVPVSVAPSIIKEPPILSAPSVIRDDNKKVTKKDKVELKSEDLPESPPVSEVSVANAKSKNASAKNKEVPKQQPPAQQQSPAPAAPQPPVADDPPAQPPPPATIPPVQPQKQTNKNNKLRELNLKGALKEGTDMDAFNDNTTLEDSTNANNPNEYVNINNTNNVMLNNNSTTIVAEIGESESKDIMTITIPTDTRTVVPKSKVDVADSIKEPPQLPKPESEDEPDCVAVDNEKLVIDNNEANAKVGNDVEVKRPSLPYETGCWTPYNMEGKKQYSRDLLLRIRDDPKSRVKPTNVPEEILACDDRGRSGEINRYASGGRASDFVPNFSNGGYQSKSSSQRGGNLPKRKSQQGQIGGNNKGSKSGGNRLTISLKDDVKLREVENAWKPARFVASANMTEDDKKTEELYKKVRGVLNKLTPQKFNTLLDQIQNFSIDTTERLQGVIDLVFEKAVDEPNFSVAYATLCNHLALLKVPVTGSTKKDDFVNFRKLLITRCQFEFEKNSIDETERNNKVKEIDECADPDKAKDLALDLEEYDRRLRIKSVGNIRFIGELYKQQMLTASIMERCLHNLLATQNEESLECLCKLLTTVGKELEGKGINLNPIFDKMKELSNKKHGKISSRVRFMIQDVLDLRLSKWVPRRQDLNPKTMDQIQKEAENEQLNIQAMNMMPPMLPARRDDRGSLGGNNLNSNMDKKRRNPDEWSIPSSRNNKGQQFSVKPDKLRHMTLTEDAPLGGKNMFGGWRDGSGNKTSNSVMNTTNAYAVLASMDDKNQGMRSGDYLKGSSMERYNRPSYDGRGSRSGSQHRSRENSAAPRIPMTVTPTPKPTPAPSLPPTPVIDAEPLLERKMNNIIDEHLNDASIKESDEEIKSSIPSNALPLFVSNGYMHVLERSQTSRTKTGSLFAYLIKVGTLSVQDYCAGFEVVLEEGEQLIIDIPMLWDYIAELIVPVLCENAITFRELHKCLLVINQNAPRVLTNIFKMIIKEKGPNFLQTSWKSCGQNFTDYMQESQVDSFLKDNSFEFMLGKDSPNHNSLFIQKNISYEEISNKLQSFLNSNASFDEVNNWITANVGDRVQETQFIRVLATAIFTAAIDDTGENKKWKNDFLKDNFCFFTKFVDSKPENELQCLHALQLLLYKLEYPQGLLLAIFNKLFEESVFSTESFIAWEEGKDQVEQEGKGVALKQLTSFYCQVKEVDEDTSSEDEPSPV